MAVANDTSSLAVVTVASSSWDRHIAAMCFSKSWTKSDSNMTSVVWGYVVMPEHFHLLLSEPAKRNVALVMQVLEQRVSRRCRRKKKSAAQMTL
jgi:REP element-mobilizing transposase RayT